MAHDIMPGGAGVNDGAAGHHDATAPLIEFLLLQHDSFFFKLYSSEAVCLGLFRLLPPLMRQVVMSMLWLQSSMKSEYLTIMLKLDPSAPHEDLDALLRPILDLRILSRQKTRSTFEYHLHREFKAGLRGGLTGGGSSQSFGVPYVPAPSATANGDESSEMTVGELVERGDRTWEGLLKYMVSSRSYASDVEDDVPHKDVLDLLVKCGLMAASVDSDGYQITSKGFQFLLEDRAVQIWQILMFYVQLRKNESGGESDGVDILRLYFTLGSMQLGRPYTSRYMTREQVRTLDRLKDYGLIARPEGASNMKVDKFYPTRLGTTLCSGDITSDSGGQNGRRAGEGFVILETNYKVYAYTDNELEIAILNLFIDIRVRYPNLIVGKLDRGTVKRAMEEGITATQIISYLTTHAHPQMHKNNPLLPVTVVDQLHLWDRERNRLVTEQVSYVELKVRYLYDAGVAYSQQIGSLIYSSCATHPVTGFLGKLVVSGYSSGPLAEYLRARREENAAS